MKTRTFSYPTGFDTVSVDQPVLLFTITDRTIRQIFKPPVTAPETTVNSTCTQSRTVRCKGQSFHLLPLFGKIHGGATSRYARGISVPELHTHSPVAELSRTNAANIAKSKGPCSTATATTPKNYVELSSVVIYPSLSGLMLARPALSRQLRRI